MLHSRGRGKWFASGIEVIAHRLSRCYRVLEEAREISEFKRCIADAFTLYDVDARSTPLRGATNDANQNGECGLGWCERGDSNSHGIAAAPFETYRAGAAAEKVEL